MESRPSSILLGAAVRYTCVHCSVRASSSALTHRYHKTLSRYFPRPRRWVLPTCLRVYDCMQLVSRYCNMCRDTHVAIWFGLSWSPCENVLPGIYLLGREREGVRMLSLPCNRFGSEFAPFRSCPRNSRKRLCYNRPFCSAPLPLSLTLQNCI